MDEVEIWLRTLTEDILLVDRVHDNVTRAKFQPCQKTVAQAIEPDLRRPLESYAETLAEFDEANNRITLYPLNTRPGAKFLQPKYPTLNHVTVEMDIQVAVHTQEDAETAFASLPDGFIRDWRWGLGIHRLFEPIFNIVRKTEIRPGDDPLDLAFQTPGWGRSLLLSRWSPTHIGPMEYVLHLSDYNRLRLGLQRIQNDHRERALSERLALTHNSLLSDLDPDTYPRQSPDYKPDTVYRVLHADGPAPKLSRQDNRALLGAVGARAETLTREAPEQVTAMIKAVQLANLDTLIERFRALYLRKHSLEADWQALLSQNRFLLSLVFGYPIVLVQEQAGVGVSNLQGKDARFADFLLKNPVTNSAALVELKRPTTDLVKEASSAGVRHIAPELVQAVMQVLDQRLRLTTHLTFHQADGHEIEAWNVGCVVIAGRDPEDKPARKALDLYRQSLKDVVVLTYGELLARLIGLREFLDAPQSAPLQPPVPTEVGATARQAPDPEDRWDD